MSYENSESAWDNFGKFPSPLVPVPNLWWLFRAHQFQLVSPSLPRSIVFFPVLLQDLGAYLSFRLLSVLLWSAGMAKSTIRQVLFFIDYHLVWYSGRDWMIRLYHKIPENFVRLIFQDGFRVLHIPFVLMDKLKFLAQFPVDHLIHPVVSRFILLALTYCIHLSWDWSFYLYHHITDINFFVAAYLLT